MGMEASIQNQCSVAINAQALNGEQGQGSAQKSKQGLRMVQVSVNKGGESYVYTAELPFLTIKQAADLRDRKISRSSSLPLDRLVINSLCDETDNSSDSDSDSGCETDDTAISEYAIRSKPGAYIAYTLQF